MLLTNTEYVSITGESAPSDFNVVLAMVQGEFDAMTLNYYNTITLTGAPQLIQDTLKRYLAFKVLGASEAGGVVAGAEQTPQSMTVGKVSFSGSQGGNPAADQLLPLLISYTNGTITLLE